VGGSLIDVSFGGAAVFVVGQRRPFYGKGAAARLSITSPFLEEPLEVSASVQYVRAVEGGQLYGFNFEDFVETWESLPLGLRQLFNHRCARRVELADPIEAQIAETDTFSVTLRNLSCAGVAFVVPEPIAQGLGEGTSLTIRFRLPGESEVMDFRARIAHQHRDNGSLFCGVFFDAKETEEYAVKRKRVHDFVNERLGRTEWNAILEELTKESPSGG